MHDRLRRLVAAGMTGLLLAAATAVPAAAGSPRAAQVRKVEPRRVVEYRPNRPFSHDTDLLSASGYAAWMIDELLRAATPLPPLGAAFTRAERDTGVNARYLVAHAILETGWGTSWIAQRKHDLFGHNAYDRDPLWYARRFPTFAAGIAAVSKEIRSAYLSPDGRWWRGFPTLRGVNRFYASDALWADKIAYLANEIDGMIVTLRERDLHFGWPRVANPTPGGAVAAHSSVVVEVPWTSRTLGLPAAIRFDVRWMPVALAEGGPTSPAGSTSATWTPVGRITRDGHTVDLSVATPTLPGSWRLEIEARDSDGRRLPATDAPPIRPLALHVAAPTEAAISVGLDAQPPVAEAAGELTPAFAAIPASRSTAGGLVATIRNVGRTTIPATAPDGTPTLVEAWSLPLAADENAVRLAGAPIGADLPPGGQVAFHVPPPVGAAVVVLRLSGDPTAIGRSVPAVVLFGSSAGGGAILAPINVPDQRDLDLVSPAPTGVPMPVTVAPGPPSGGTASVSIMPADTASTLTIGLLPAPAPRALDLPAEPPALPPWILVRTLSNLSADAVDPTSMFMPWPVDPAAEASGMLSVAGLPAGVRLVVVALVPAGGSVADPASVRLAWVHITDPATGPTPR
jgi:beta-N-acetylglucosaminidase